LSTNQVDDNQSKYNVECITRVEVVTRFDGDSGGELTANDIMNQITNLLVTKNQNAFDLSSYNFNCYTSTNSGVTYLEQDTSDHTYFRAILELSNKIEQTI
jgi:recombinational DNA repair protein (RecF pathway)